MQWLSALWVFKTPLSLKILPMNGSRRRVGSSGRHCAHVSSPWNPRCLDAVATTRLSDIPRVRAKKTQGRPSRRTASLAFILRPSSQRNHRSSSRSVRSQIGAGHRRDMQSRAFLLCYDRMGCLNACDSCSLYEVRSMPNMDSSCRALKSRPVACLKSN